ncbi:MAG: hypothetical protein JO019_04060 [Candidatus Kaiserbacteria bacterium]|nr:hypothetical protein [Candidatus Kaiserbacteria bacterium]
MPNEAPRRAILSHPFAILCAIAIMLFLIGGTIVMSRTPHAINGASDAWGSNATTLINPTSFSPYYRDNSAVAPPLFGATTTGTIHIFHPPAPQTTVPAQSSDMDFDNFLAQLMRPAAAQTTSTVNIDSKNAYSFIPQGFVSTSTQKKRTAAQDALYEYGNVAGTIVRSFEDAHPDEVQILAAQAADRGNALKSLALASLGDDLTAAGAQLAVLPHVPDQARAANGNLARDYQMIGQKLKAIALAKNDGEFLAAITSYNASADGFTRDYIALATIFAVAGVSFDKTEGGAAFMFSNTGSF